MTELNEELLDHIANRNGELARSIATYREVVAQLDALNAHPIPSIQVTVHVAGKHYTMRVIVQVLRAQHEADLAILARRIREAAAIPFDWLPQQPAFEPDALPPPSPTPEGDTTNG